MRFALLIVGEQLGRAANVFAVLRMLHQALDLNRDRLLHFGADDLSGEGARLLVSRLRFGWRIGAHFLSPAALVFASFMMVFRRAMLRRTLVNWSGLGNCPVARCRRRENCSLRSFTSSSASSGAFLLRSSLASI